MTTIITLICPESKAPCTEEKGMCVCVDEAQGNTFCKRWIEKQRAIGRKHLEDNTSNPPKART